MNGDESEQNSTHRKSAQLCTRYGHCPMRAAAVDYEKHKHESQNCTPYILSRAQTAPGLQQPNGQPKGTQARQKKAKADTSPALKRDKCWSEQSKTGPSLPRRSSKPKQSTNTDVRACTCDDTIHEWPKYRNAMYPMSVCRLVLLLRSLM